MNTSFSSSISKLEGVRKKRKLFFFYDTFYVYELAKLFTLARSRRGTSKYLLYLRDLKLYIIDA